MSETRCRGGRTALALLFLSLVATRSGRVRADTAPSDADKATALTTVREGNRLLTSGRPEAALEKFKEAHRLVSGDKLYFNFGQAYRAMPGHEVDAYQAFQRYLDRVKTASPESLAAARAEQTEVRSKLALVTVTTSPTGATVTVDGQSQGETPLARPLVLLPGSHALHIVKDGYRPVEQGLLLTAGQSLEKEIALAGEPAAVARAAPPPTAAPLPSPPAQETRPASVLTPVVAAPQDNDGRGSAFYRRWWFWTAVGAAVAGVAVVAATRGGGTTTTFPCPADQSCARL